MKTITRPGKFQGEPLWAPYLHDQDADQDFYDGADTLYRAYKIAARAVLFYPDLRGVFAVVLTESDDGFVHAKTFATSYELGVFINECALEAEAEELGTEPVLPTDLKGIPQVRNGIAEFVEECALGATVTVDGADIVTSRSTDTEFVIGFFRKG